MKTKVSTRIDGTDFEFNTKFSHSEAIRFYDPFHSAQLASLGRVAVMTRGLRAA